MQKYPKLKEWETDLSDLDSRQLLVSVLQDVPEEEKEVREILLKAIKPKTLSKQ